MKEIKYSPDDSGLNLIANRDFLEMEATKLKDFM